MKRVYHFLGSVVFAVILIFLTATMVAVGTYLESITESHQHAAEWIYKSVYFKILLIGFFVNILVSALRRWPFRSKHVPFLMTHLGLLMVITGTFIKTVWGLQGNLLLIEGSSNASMQIPDTLVIAATNREGKRLHLPLTKNLFGQYTLPKNMFCELLDFCPHSEENIFAWISDHQAHFHGHSPFVAHDWQPGMPLPKSNPLALNTEFKNEAIQTILEEGLDVVLSPIGTFPLKELVQGIELPNGSFKATLKKETLEIHYESAEKKGDVILALSGSTALLNQHNFLGKAPITVDLISKIPLCLLQDKQRCTTLLAADAHGRIYLQNFEANRLPSYIAYNDGFDGYTVQAEFLGPEELYSRKDMEERIQKELAEQLSAEHHSAMLPIIKIFHEACKECEIDFADGFVHFLEEWHQKGGWLYPENTPLSKKSAQIFRAFNWSSLNPEELRSSLWLSYFFKDFDKALAQGENFLTLLKLRGWPLVPSLELLKNDEERLTLFSQQLFAMGAELPWIAFPQDPEMLARILTAFLRLYGIHYSYIPLPQFPLKTIFLSVESPLLRESVPLSPLPKLEDNNPRALLKLFNGEEIALTFNKFKWPTKDGQYLLQFHAQKIELPYTIRLHKAKQINYPESDQAFSYESEITITDRRTDQEVRQMISMNEVYETWDGYRFYLSGLSKNSSGAHVVQLVINRDPAKYWLTYPGGLLIALGILLLFWWRK